MPGHSSPTLGRIVAHMARLSPARHRDLARGMAAEIDSIPDPAARTRFALGAIAAIARLALRGYGRALVHAPGRFVGMTEPEDEDTPGGPSMSKIPTRRLLLRHALPFAVSCGALTVLMVVNHAARRVPELSARGVPAGGIVEVVLLAVPFTLALTIPMAVFIAVSWVFSRLGAQGVLASARRERHGVRRLVAPVLGAAAIIGGLTLVSNAQLLPRANARLVTALSGVPNVVSDRTMTLGELRDAARIATGANAPARAAAYEVEFQKRIALAAACLVLALAGAVIPMRFPHGGMGLVAAASVLVFTAYYVSLVFGESLADRQALSPFLSMWLANGVLLAVVLVLSGGRSRPGPTHGAETLAIDG